MTTAPAALGERERRLLAEAAEWRLLSLLFECPSPQWREYVRALGRQVPAADLRAAARAALRQASEGLYHSAFGPGGPAPAREASYRDVIQLGQLLAELEHCYQAFAYQPAAPETPDHVAVETGFLAYLKLKEAYALACSEEDHAAVSADAATHILDEHLSFVAQPLAAALGDSGVPYLAKAAQALARRVGPPRSSPAPLPVLGDPEESTFCCQDDST